MLLVKAGITTPVDCGLSYQLYEQFRTKVNLIKRTRCLNWWGFENVYFTIKERNVD